jgi:hypothetical protein
MERLAGIGNGVGFIVLELLGDGDFFPGYRALVLSVCRCICLWLVLLPVLLGFAH